MGFWATCIPAEAEAEPGAPTGAEVLSSSGNPSLDLLTGVLAQVVGTFGAASGFALAHWAWRAPTRRKRYGYWVASVACTLGLGEVGGLLALTVLPITLVAPLGSLTNAWNAIFYGYEHGWRQVPWRWVALLLISCVLVADSIPRVPRSVPDARRVAAAAVAASFPIAILWISYDWLTTRTRLSSAVPGLVAGFTQTLFKTFAVFLEVFVERPECRGYWPLAQRLLAFGLCTGAFGLIQFARVISIVRRHSPITAYPLYWISILASTEVVGGLVLGEFNGASMPPPAFFLGVVGCVLSVWRLGAVTGEPAADGPAPVEYRELATNVTDGVTDGARWWRRRQMFSL